MAELDLWHYTLNEDSFQELSAKDRMALVSIATQVAFDETDGFLKRSAVRRVPWNEGPKDLRESIPRLVEAGLLIESIEPPGWHIEGWLEDARQVLRLSHLHVRIGWGQRPAEKIQQARQRSRDSSKRHRDAQDRGKG